MLDNVLNFEECVPGAIVVYPPNCGCDAACEFALFAFRETETLNERRLEVSLYAPYEMVKEKNMFLFILEQKSMSEKIIFVCAIEDMPKVTFISVEYFICCIYCKFQLEQKIYTLLFYLALFMFYCMFINLFINLFFDA